jgi:glyoxylase-like metal-dependent hydrolase (beta-lactamase superfamily II)
MSGWGELFDQTLWIPIVQGGKTVVIGTGFPHDRTICNEYMRAFHPDSGVEVKPENEMPSPLLRAGVDPAEVDVVILSPLAFYTTGNLSLFTKAQICILRRGWVDFMAPDPFSPQQPRQVVFSKEGLCWLLSEAWERVRLLEDEDEVLSGIRTWFSGVHHRSSMAIEIDTEKGVVLFSDSFLRYANIEKNVPIGLAESLSEAYRSYARIRKTADILLPILDPEVGVRHPNGLVA